jgi:FKBP-type peptidyl-prolyl cis-trans isomerase SlyD
MQIGANTVVTIEYTLRDQDGQVLDSSQDSQPLAYIHGHGQLIPGVEAELAGKEPGAELRFNVPPERGYGHYSEDAFQMVSKSNFPDDVEIAEGQQFWLTDQSGNQRHARIESISDDQVRLDFNHPLAGVALDFEVKVLDVRQASEEELAHGHAHGEHGAHD